MPDTASAPTFPTDRGWRLSLGCLQLLRRHPRLLLLPLASLGVLLLEVLALVAIYRLCAGDLDPRTFLAPGPGPHPGWLLLGLPLTLPRAGLALVVGCAALLVFTTTALFFQAAQASCILTILEGGDGSLRAGLRAAARHPQRLFGFAALSLLAKLCIGQLAGLIPGFGGKVAEWVGGATWAVASFLVLPVLVLEDRGLGATVRKSAALLRGTWGDQLRIRIGLGLWEIGAVLAYGLLGVAVLVAAITLGATYPVVGALVAAGVLGFVLLLLVLSSLTPVFSAILYSYAVTGMLPQEIAPGLIPPRRTP